MEASNLKELKDAATELMRFTCNSCERRFCEEDAEEEDGQSVPSLCGPIIRMRNALSANPIRNCDVGTAEEQTKRFADFCAEHRHTDLPRCAGCPLENTPPDTGCSFAWGQMLYKAEEGGSKK